MLMLYNQVPGAQGAGVEVAVPLDYDRRQPLTHSFALMSDRAPSLGEPAPMAIARFLRMDVVNAQEFQDYPL